MTQSKQGASGVTPTVPHRSWPITVVWLAVASASLGLLAWIFVIHASLSNRIMGSVLLGGVGLVCLIGAAVAAQVAPCPVCGRNVTAAPELEDLCECGTLSLLREGRVHALGDDYASGKRRFLLPIRAGIAFPNVCAGCGAPATRSESVRYRLSAAWKALIAVSTLADGGLSYADESLEAKVPVCDRCEGAAEIVDLHKPDLVLRVRSWGFTRAYAKANPKLPPPTLG